ncbi:hypothetical protein DBR06_SOUSAS110374, partial [Sousa chinensis]
CAVTLCEQVQSRGTHLKNNLKEY